MTRFRQCASAAAALMLAACAADPTAPKAGVTDAMLTNDVARDVSATVRLDLDQMLFAELAGGLPLGSSSAAGSPLCPYSAAAGRFVCPAIALPDGPTLTRSYALWAGNVPQSAYDPATTDSMNFQSTLAGAMTLGASTSWMHHTRSLTVSGLAGTETQRTWNGLGARSDSAHVVGDGPMRRTTLESVDRIDNLVFELPRAAHPFPRSGSISEDLTATASIDGAAPGDARSIARHVVVTFDGTRTARVFVGAVPCTLDLVTHAVKCQ